MRNSVACEQGGWQKSEEHQQDTSLEKDPGNLELEVTGVCQNYKVWKSLHGFGAVQGARPSCFKMSRYEVLLGWLLQQGATLIGLVFKRSWVRVWGVVAFDLSKCGLSIRFRFDVRRSGHSGHLSPPSEPLKSQQPKNQSPKALSSIPLIPKHQIPRFLNCNTLNCNTLQSWSLVTIPLRLPPD